MKEEKLYIVEESLYQPNGGCWSDFLNIIGVFKDKDNARACFQEKINEIILSDTREGDEVQPLDIKLQLKEYYVELESGEFIWNFLREERYSYLSPKKQEQEILEITEVYNKTENLLGKYSIIISVEFEGSESIYRITKNKEAALEMIRAEEENSKMKYSETFNLYKCEMDDKKEQKIEEEHLKMPVVNIPNDIAFEI